MTIKDEYYLKDCDSQYLIICSKNSNEEINTLILQNDTSKFLWDMLKTKDCSKAQMLDELLNNYNISTVLALGNIDTFVKSLNKYGIAE